ncbi:hypothetical protein MNB_SV-13-1488 [hydrothermal vent metagenome]|uniref:Uncharacterized protein n=1 Tax=hydrothermal vent metagenome TaxID=652676 RepID=A0A1W1D0H6_9ZZZZ
MDNEKATLDEWKKHLSKYYNTSTIERYYREHNGSTEELSCLLIKKYKTQGLNSVRRTLKNRQYQHIKEFHVGIQTEESTFMKRRKRKSKGEVIYLDKKEKAFDDFFNNKLSTFFEYKGIGIGSNLLEKTIDKLDIILKDYYDEFHEMEELKALTGKGSYSEREKEIKKILEKTNKILELTGSELYNTLPKEIKIKTLNELNKTTKEKLEELNLPRINRDYSSLLKSLREL